MAGERLGEGDALGVLGVQREGDRHALCGQPLGVVALVEGLDLADVDDLRAGDDDLRDVGVGVLLAREGREDVHPRARGDLARDTGLRVDHDGDLHLPGLEFGPGGDHVGLEQRALLQRHGGDLPPEVAEFTYGGVGQPAPGHGYATHVGGAQRGVRGDVGGQFVRRDLGSHLRARVADDGEHPGEGGQRAEHGDDQEDDTSALT